MFPVLYQNGPIIVFTHDFFTLLGLAVGLLVYYRELRRRGMLSYQIFWISMAAIVGGGIGARLSVVWEHPAYYANIGSVPLSYFFTHSGKSIIGGIVGGYLAIVIAKRAFRYTRSTGDCYAAAIPLAMAIGRVGCFLSELPLGKPTDLPWGIAASQEAASHFEVCPYCTGMMHPTMVYEIVFHLLAFALILRFRHLVIVQGDTLKIYLLAAAVFRFLVEFLRANPEMVGGLTGAQVALIPLSVPLVIHFVRQWRRGVYRMPPVPGARRVAAASWETVPHLAEEERAPA
ncbi:MAG TPA: prolipoprotein diacylglyceryl transferase family protein [Chloroflexia bacterium]|nr:prolipoprotein diacylglyceryl transferase family protein [Chloroflexia bacterium]